MIDVQLKAGDFIHLAPVFFTAIFAGGAVFFLLVALLAGRALWELPALFRVTDERTPLRALSLPVGLLLLGFPLTDRLGKKPVHGCLAFAAFGQGQKVKPGGAAQLARPPHVHQAGRHG